MGFEHGNAVALLALAASPSFVSVPIFIKKDSLGKSQGGLKDLRARSRNISARKSFDLKPLLQLVARVARKAARNIRST